MSVEKTWDGQDQLDIPLQSRLGGKQKLVPWDLQPKSHLHCDINIKNRQKNQPNETTKQLFPYVFGTLLRGAIATRNWNILRPTDVSLRNKTWGVTPKDATTTRLQWISPLQNASQHKEAELGHPSNGVKCPPYSCLHA